MSNIIKFYGKNDPTLDEIVKEMADDFVATAEAKKQLFLTAYQNAKACVRENFMDLSKFSVNDDVERFLGQVLEATLENGIVFTMLDDCPNNEAEIEGLEYVHEVLCQICTAKDGKCVIAAHLSRINVDMEREMLIDGKWTDSFSFEEDGVLRAGDED